MTQTEQFLRRQAEWQHNRRHLSWPEKIRQAERLRTTVEAFRAQRRQDQADAAMKAQTERQTAPETE